MQKFIYSVEDHFVIPTKPIEIPNQFFVRHALDGGKIGDETASGESQRGYNSCFSYSIASDVGIGGTYIYAQANTQFGLPKYDWMIQQISPDGKLGKVTKGAWDQYYTSCTHYASEGRSFLYSQGPKGWFIQELLPDGLMGKETDRGTWNGEFGSCCAFQEGHYNRLYAQQNGGDNLWFIQELLPGGKMGKNLDSGKWKEPYGICFTYGKVKTYLYVLQKGHSNLWSIYELLDGARVGPKTSDGKLNNEFSSACPYTGSKGGEFFYRQAKDNNWIIQELTNEGKVGKETDHGTWKHSYATCTTVVPLIFGK